MSKLYPEKPLGPQVRDYDETQSVWSVIRKEFFECDRCFEIEKFGVVEKQCDGSCGYE